MIIMSAHVPGQMMSRGRRRRVPFSDLALVSGKARWVIDVHGRQILHVLLGDGELDAFAGAGHRADRDSHFLTAPQMTLLQEHMGDVMAARVEGLERLSSRLAWDNRARRSGQLFS
jgi:hypothetical protein